MTRYTKRKHTAACAWIRTRTKCDCRPPGGAPPTPLRADGAADVNSHRDGSGKTEKSKDVPHTDDIRIGLAPTEVDSIMDQLTDAELKELVEGEEPEFADQMAYEWPFWARANQIPPPGDWDGWLILAGRMGGKTRTGAEWVRAEIEAGRAKRVALIGETSADGKDVMVNGDSGLLSVCPPSNMPTFKASNNDGRPKLIWPNGAIATLYDARVPDQLRGPQHDLCWFDELAKFRYAQEVFDQAMFGLRLGNKPRWLATTTPRPIKLLKDLIRDKHVVVTKYSSNVNLKNVAPSVKNNILERYAGTRLGRQELDAEILDDTQGALWSRRNLDDNRLRLDQTIPTMQRIVVGVDPAVTSGDSSNETGIVAVGMDENGKGYVIEDASLRGSPDQWARAAIALYRKWEADRVVVEVNQGGDLVKRTLQSIDPLVAISEVRATRGKYVRAEPISALYEQERVRHIGTFPALEDQQISFTPEAAAIRTSKDHYDRVDALVWAFTDLFGAMTAPIRRTEEYYEEVRSYSHDSSGRDVTTGY